MIRFANVSVAHKIQMRLYGIICAVSGISFLAIYRSNQNAYGHGKEDFYIVGYAITFLAFAAGLLAVRLWVELIFNFCLLCLSLSFVAALLINHETDLSLIFVNLAVVALLMTPVAICIYRLKHQGYFLRGA
jgi:hypothetical protein